MLKTIVHPAVKLNQFIVALKLALYKPQINHLKRVADSLIVCDRRKTLTNLYREYVDQLDPKTAADFFRESPWAAEQVGQPRRAWMLAELLAFCDLLGYEGPIVISIDDSLGKKHKDTRHLEAVDFSHNHTESTRRRQVYSNGYVYVEAHVQIGSLGFTFDIQLYLREKTVRRLNRKRSPKKRLHFRSKYRIARAMLVEIAALLPLSLPKGRQVYVTFDSWYASAKLIKFCRRKSWHVICALKSNRLLNGKSVKKHDRSQKHRRYIRVRMGAVDETQLPSYYVRTVGGHLEDVRDEVCVIISRRHPGKGYPKYFMCTDLSLSAQEALRIYQQRWPVEVDNFYLKVALGLGDFRLQSFEAIQKWFQVVTLALNYLQYQQAQEYLNSGSLPSLADIIRQHRSEHAKQVLRTVAEQVLRLGAVEPILRRFISLQQGVT
jgi:hypothetical protein